MLKVNFPIMNKLNSAILIVFLLLLTPWANAQEELNLFSPNKLLEVQIKSDNDIKYTVKYKDEIIFSENRLELELDNEILGKNPKLKNTKREEVSETFNPVVPLKFSEIENEYNLLRLNFRNDFSVEFRAYDEGIAYRFILNKRNKVEILNELMELNLNENATAHLQQTGSFKTSYENPYTHINTSEFNENTEMATLPVLLETDNNINVLISESDLRDYPAIFLKGISNNKMKAVFPKAPLEFGEDGDRSVKILKEAEYIAETDGTRALPWRYFVISETDGDIVENTMTAKLAGKLALKNTDWIRPGQVSWEWWNGASPYNVDFVAGFNEETYRYFIDFASEFGIPYIIMDEGWAKSTTDPYTPNPDIDLFKLIEYGKQKNVDIVLWLTWLTVDENMELFEKFHEWGIAGVKIDFMDRSDQWMVNYYENVAKKAAEHEMFIDFHGSFKPAGLEYMYPNILSYEGVLGMEQMGRAKPENSIYFPFMRNAVGAMDYTPGAMLSMQPEYYGGDRPNSASIGTRSYQMALFVVFESGLQMLADNPTNYFHNRECTEFITSVPTTWDETVVLNAEIGKSIIVAKRKGKKWFIGGMNGTNEDLEYNINFDFLEEQKPYEITSFEDGLNSSRQAMEYRKKENQINSKTAYTVKMVRNGGWAAVINETN